ncbi:YfiR family protein [Azonexus sp. IMCC34839]|uniref:YfiR family protein n=1 Tax=Azonexus sp. IMCC34839 TaxID=3133695 RepID=UPI003999EA82
MRTLLILLFGTWLAAGSAGAQPISEYEMKALYMLNFVSYIEWPEAERESFNLCTYGDDEMASNLARFDGRLIGRERVSIARLTSLGMIRKCQMVFVGEREIANLQRVANIVADLPVLVVTDIPQLDSASIVLSVSEKRLVFDINFEQCRRMGLKPNSKLLRLARFVKKPGQP